MNSPNGITFEILSTGPGVGWWSTPEQREHALQDVIGHQLEEIQLKQTVYCLLAAEEKRCQSRVRRAKPVSISAGKGFLTASEVAYRLQVHLRTVEKYIEKGAWRAGTAHAGHHAMLS